MELCERITGSFVGSEKRRCFRALRDAFTAPTDTQHRPMLLIDGKSSA